MAEAPIDSLPNSTRCGRAGIEGKWHCANFFGDSLEITELDDGALIIESALKRIRSFRYGLRLERRSEHCWEAKEQIRMRRSGKKLLLQEYRLGKWGSELQSFREGLAATGAFFRGFLRKSNASSSEQEFTLERQSSTVFKLTVAPFDIEAAFTCQPRDLSSVKPESIHGSEECKICMARNADVVLLPCAHGGLCEECVWQMQEAGAVSCPFCRQTVEKVAMVETGASHVILREDDMKPISEIVSNSRKIAWA